MPRFNEFNLDLLEIITQPFVKAQCELSPMQEAELATMHSMAEDDAKGTLDLNGVDIGLYGPIDACLDCAEWITIAGAPEPEEEHPPYDEGTYSCYFCRRTLTENDDHMDGAV